MPKRMLQPHYAPVRGTVSKASPPLNTMTNCPAMVKHWTPMNQGLQSTPRC